MDKIITFKALLDRINRKLAHEHYKMRTVHEGVAKTFKLFNGRAEHVRTFVTPTEVVAYGRHLACLKADEKVLLTTRRKDAKPVILGEGLRC